MLKQDVCWLLPGWGRRIHLLGQSAPHYGYPFQAPPWLVYCVADMHSQSGHNSTVVAPCFAAFRGEIAGTVNREWENLEVPWNAPWYRARIELVGSLRCTMEVTS